MAAAFMQLVAMLAFLLLKLPASAATVTWTDQYW
jgi:hypothetical protein